MRAMSFMLTVRQILARLKTVTRRLKWLKLTPGTRLQAVEKCMGLKKGQKHNQLATIEITAVTREPLDAITQEDCAAEGFPDMTPAEFVEMFCRSMRCTPQTVITRIEFKYVDEGVRDDAEKSTRKESRSKVPTKADRAKMRVPGAKK